MKKHILSKYCDEQSCIYNKKIYSYEGKTTYETSTVEVSDPDEMFLAGNTKETRRREDSDPDEFLMGPTSLTKSVEDSDVDAFIFGPTMVTEQIESSDPDDFILSGPTNLTFTKEDSDVDEFVSEHFLNSNYYDFDDILLI